MGLFFLFFFDFYHLEKDYRNWFSPVLIDFMGSSFEFRLRKNIVQFAQKLLEKIKKFSKEVLFGNQILSISLLFFSSSPK